MFDWPDATHTSPTATFFTVRLFLPVTVMSPAGPAVRPSSFTFHLPSAAAVAFTSRAPSFTVTASCGAAQPQTFAGVSGMRTMLSLMTAGSLTSARATTASRREDAPAKQRRAKGERFMGVRRGYCGVGEQAGFGGGNSYSYSYSRTPPTVPGRAE